MAQNRKKPPDLFGKKQTSPQSCLCCGGKVVFRKREEGRVRRPVFCTGCAHLPQGMPRRSRREPCFYSAAEPSAFR